MTMSRTTRWLLAGLVALAVSTTLLEGALQLREHRRMSRTARLRLHPFLQVVPSSELLDHVNPQGFRGDPLDRHKPADVFRIFALGGSTTLGVRTGYASTYPAKLQQLLRARYPDIQIEVQNAASDWYTTAHSLINYQLRVRPYEPDMVIVFHAINDLCRSFAPSWWASGPFQDDYSHYLGPLIRLRGLEAGFIEPPSSHRLGNLLVWRKARELMGAASPYDGTPAGIARLRRTLTPAAITEFPSLDPFRVNFGQLARAVRDDGHTFIMASQPYVYSSTMSDTTRSRLLFGPVFCSENGTYPDDASMAAGLARFNQTARGVAESLDLPFLDFEARVPKTDEYFFDDVHMTEAGHEILASVVFDWIVRARAIETFASRSGS
jgi:lysophospholipase L1-like esterase